MAARREMAHKNGVETKNNKTTERKKNGKNSGKFDTKNLEASKLFLRDGHKWCTHKWWPKRVDNVHAKALELAMSVGRFVTFFFQGFPLLPTRPRLRGSVYGLVEKK